MKKLLIILLLIYPLSVKADDLTFPTTYSTNGQVTATNLNGNFQAVAATVNGGLDNDNANTAGGYRFFETKSSLPAAGSQGRTIFLTSDNSMNFDTGSTWGKVSTAAGIVMPAGAIFFMITGSCPTGSTDVSATYSNKFLKVNATAGTSSGVVLTGTVDSHTLTSGEVPAHTHAAYYNAGGVSTDTVPNVSVVANGTAGSIPTGSYGSGGGHTHTVSAATTLEPSSITAKLCLVS